MDHLTNIIEEVKPFYTDGEVVDYMPILKNIDISLFNVSSLNRLNFFKIKGSGHVLTAALKLSYWQKILYQ